MYGNSTTPKIDENSPLNPLYPYGITKTYTHNYLQEYRKKFNLKCSSLILFNHESPFRNENFLSKKVASFVAKILKGGSGFLELGNLSAYKDISHALDFMNGLKIIIDGKINEDFVLSSGKQIKTYDFVKKFFTLYNLDMKKYVKFITDNRNETLNIYGDNTKLTKHGWSPNYDIDKLIIEMVNKELWT
jgi:GDPmannose 4,6-dehydratase